MSALQSLFACAWVDALGWTLVHSVWEGVAIAIVLAIVLRVMRGRSAAARYVVAMGMMFVSVAGAIATFALLNHRAPKAMPVAVETAPVFVSSVAQRIPIDAPVASIPAHDPTWTERLQPILPWLVFVWAIGVVVIGFYQVGGWIVVGRIRRTGIALDDAGAMANFDELIRRLRITRPVRLVRSALVQVPTVIGAFKPVVILPINALTGLTTDQLRGLLAHELAHVRRHDYLLNAIQTIVETLLFYHPAVWWMSRVIRQERENACDDLASEICDRETYAQALASMERLRQTSSLALSARGGALLPRIRRILGISKTNRPRSGWPAMVTILLILAVATPFIALHVACHTDNATAANAPTTKPAADLLEGHITDAATGKPVPNVKVKTYGGLATRWLTGTTTTDANGYYRFDNPGGAMIKEKDADPWDLTVGMEMEHPTLCSNDGNSWWDVRLTGSPRHATKDFALTPGGNLIGTVTDSAGQPRTRLDVRIYNESDKKQRNFLAYAATDDRGNFSTPSLFPGEYTIDVNSSDPFYPKLGSATVNGAELKLLSLKYDGPAPTSQPAGQADARQGQPAAEPVTAEDLKPNTGDYRIGPNDLVQMSISDLQAPGSDTVKQARVSEGGNVSLPLIGQVHVAGQTEEEFAKSAQQAYQNAGFLKQGASVSVTTMERRGRTFSILGAVNQPGQYAITKNDFRLLDALVVAHGTSQHVPTATIIRAVPGKPPEQSRKIEVPLDPLLAGDTKSNLVIRPEDMIILAAADTPAPSANVAPNADGAPSRREQTEPSQPAGNPNAPSAKNDDPPVHPVTADDLKPKTELYRVTKNDLLQVSVNDPHSIGSPPTVKETRVSETGNISLPLIGQVQAAGQTKDELEKSIGDKYVNAGFLKDPWISVEVIEARGRTFAILGAVKQPGEYEIHKPDFRLLDALIIARGEDPAAPTAIVLRKQEGTNPQHQIQIPLSALHSQTEYEKYNVVIRPGDMIVIRPPESSIPQSITTADLKSEKTEYTLAPDDEISVSIWDITAQGAETKRQASIGETGTISMPLVGNVAVAGKTVSDAEKAIAKAYEDASFLHHATVIVTLLQSRSRSFSILFSLASAGTAGQYSIPTSDFRLLDALAMSKAQLAQIDNVKVRRDGGEKDRLLEIPSSALTSGDPQFNVVIRPKDTIIVQAREDQPAAAAPAPQETRIQILQQQLDQARLSLEQLSSKLTVDNPQVIVAKQQVDNLQKVLEQARQESKPQTGAAPQGILQDGSVLLGGNVLYRGGTSVAQPGNITPQEPKSPATTQPISRGQYYISGVPRTGVYSLGGHVNLRQSLIAAGFTDELRKSSLVLIRHDAAGAEARRSFAIADIMDAEVGNTEVQPDDTIMVSAPIAGEYTIGGDVPRTGVYSLTGRQVNLLQALISAGANPQEMKEMSIEVQRRDKNKPDQQSHFQVSVPDLLKTGVVFLLEPDDVVTVRKSASDTAAHFVRLVIGKDRMTFEGKDVAWDSLAGELKNVPDRGNTALQLALADESVTIGEQNNARGRCLAIVNDLGFKYLTEIGIHPIGSKAGEENATTQRATTQASALYIRDRLGRLDADHSPARFTFDTDATSIAIQPGPKLEAMKGLLRNSPKGTRFRVSGTVTNEKLAIEKFSDVIDSPAAPAS